MAGVVHLGVHSIEDVRKMALVWSMVLESGHFGHVGLHQLTEMFRY